MRALGDDQCIDGYPVNSAGLDQIAGRRLHPFRRGRTILDRESHTRTGLCKRLPAQS
jgi:hypothetical protein